MSHFDKKLYWETKILPWERARYFGFPMPASLTLRRRLRMAAAAAREVLPSGGSVVELGCGSGLLAEKLRGQFSRYLGVDLAECAVAEARARAVPGAQFEQGAVLARELPEADVAVFLGLVDWLADDEIEGLFSKLKVRHMIFSFTAPPPLWSPYRWYRAAYDRLRGGGVYRARCFAEAEVRAWLPADARIKVLPRKPFDPGRLVVVELAD